MKKALSILLGITLLTSTMGIGIFAQSYNLPQANLIISPAIGEASTSFTFDASDSTSGDGESNLEYRWQFRSGRDWTSFSGSSKATYVPWDDGTFRAKLQVRDRKTKQTQTTYRTYRARTHFPRRANLYADPLSPKAGESVHFWVDVFKVRNEDIDDIDVRWDFEGDGRWDTSWSPSKETWHAFGANQIQKISPRAEVRYADGTVKSVQGLRPAKGTNGSKGKTSRKRTIDRGNDFGGIRVTKPAVTAPILDIGPGSYGPHPQTQFTFDAKASKIPRGGWTEWSFDGDTFEKGPLFIRKIFESSGKHTVEVRTCVGFSRQQCATTKASFVVKGPKTTFWVRSSVSAAGSSGSVFTKVNDLYSQGYIGQKVRLSANAHANGNKSVPNPQYRWDFDGDGTFDTGASTTSQQTYTFQKTGRFRPTVEVISSQGIRAQATLVVDIAANTPPTGSLKLSSSEIMVGQSFTAQADVTDRESQISTLKVRFDMDGDGQWDGDFNTTRTVTWRYNEPGGYTIRMQARDGQGRTFNDEALLIVRPNPLLTHNPGEAEGSRGENNGSNNGTTGTSSGRNGFSAGSQTNNSSGGASRGSSSRSSGQRNLRIPIAAPQFEIHKDFKEYAEYATGWDDSTDGPQALEPWLTPEGGSAENKNQGSVTKETGSGPVNSQSTATQSQSSTNNSVSVSQGGNPTTTKTQRDWNTSMKEGTAAGEKKEGVSLPSFPKRGLGGDLYKKQKEVLSTSKEPSSQSSFLQKLNQRYQNTSIAPPYPGENPFRDVRDTDPHYEVAVQAYRDGLAVGPYFFR